MKAHLRRSVAAWLFAALGTGLLASSCIIPPEEVRGPCKTDVDCADDKNPCTKEVCAADGFCDKKPQDLPPNDPGCDDLNPCTKEACSEGKCVYSPQDLPFGNKDCDDGNECTDDVCQAGACGHVTASIPPDDGNPCTSDACVEGIAKHDPLPDNTPCGKDDMLVCTAGACNCQKADECGLSTECLKFACTNNECSSTSLEQGTLVDNKDPGDCLKRVCDGMNNVVTAPDTADPPPEVAGDCKKKACDASGNPVDTVDDTDVPATDNNDCTTEACSNGTVSDHTPVANGMTCGMNGADVCDVAMGGGYQFTAGDKCMAGVCTPSSPVTCGYYRCNGAKCKVACSADADCISGAFCDMGTNTCKPQGNTGTSCQNDGQCSSTHCVDGVCCNSLCDGFCQRCNDAGSNGFCIFTQAGQDPNNECTGTAACDGQGACAAQIGSPCAMDLDCLAGICEDGYCCDIVCSGACKRCDIGGLNGTCSPVDLNMTATGCGAPQACDGIGNCKTTAGQACAQNSDCLSGFCEDNICCGTACVGSCNRCDIAGSVGTCTNVPSGQQPQGCNANNACNGAGACKKVNGQTCSNAVDCVSGFCPSENGNGSRYCCDTACSGTCQSCAGAKTVGMANGVCDNVKDKTDPDQECSGQCMGNGNGCCVINNGMPMCQ